MCLNERVRVYLCSSALVFVRMMVRVCLHKRVYINVCMCV